MLHACVLLWGAAWAAGQADSRPTVTATADKIVISHCLISLAEDAQVPARDAGQLTAVAVVVGQQVAKGQVLAQIDDVRAQLELVAAEHKYDVEKQKSTNDVNVRYAKKGADVSHHAYLQKVEANRKVVGTITDIELEQTKLEWEKFVLQIEQSQFELSVAALEAQVRKAEVDAATEGVDRRKVRAPFDGEVVDIKKQLGEWVLAGDTVLQIQRMDRLWIEAFLHAREFAPSEIAKRPVTVRVQLARGREEVFQGRVVWVKSQVESTGDFRIRAEVFNRSENDFWLLRPGDTAEMTILLK